MIVLQANQARPAVQYEVTRGDTSVVDATVRILLGLLSSTHVTSRPAISSCPSVWL